MLVADAFDAITSTRPYRAALLCRARVREDCSTAPGSQFDPACVDALLELLERREAGRSAPSARLRAERRARA